MAYGELGAGSVFGEDTGTGTGTVQTRESCKGILDTKIHVQRHHTGTLSPDQFTAAVRTRKSCECYPPGTAPEVKKCDVDPLPVIPAGQTRSEVATYTCKEYVTECPDPPHECGDEGWCPCPDTPTPLDFYNEDGSVNGESMTYEDAGGTFRNLAPGFGGRAATHIERLANQNISKANQRLGTCTRPGVFE